MEVGDKQLSSLVVAIRDSGRREGSSEGRERREKEQDQRAALQTGKQEGDRRAVITSCTQLLGEGPQHVLSVYAAPSSFLHLHFVSSKHMSSHDVSIKIHI